MLSLLCRCVAAAVLLAPGVADALESSRAPSLEHWPSDDFAIPDVAPESTASTADEVIFDPEFELVQAQASPVAPRSPGAARPNVRIQPTALRRAGAGIALGGIASIPYMIGDTGSGSCIGFSGLVDAMLSHPTLACGRLNIAEANSPLPTDRVYYSYRHFANSNKVSAYQFSETLDLDQHTIAWENAFWDRTGSLEVRVPIEQRLRSDVFSIIAPNFGVVDPLVAPGDGRRAELGNVSLVFKMLLQERETYAVTGGVGFTLPTAQDVNYQLAVDGEVEFPGSPGLTADQAVAFQSVFASETVYVSPFLAWVVAPRSQWFHQGFLQVEVAANPSRVTVVGDGATLFLQNGVPIGFYDYFTPVPVRAELFAQTLMRLNLGWGYILAERQAGAKSSQLAALFELHYTSTLQDANLTDVPLTTQSSVGTVPLQTIVLGNADNRVDIINAAVGLAGRWGSWILANGVIVPLRPMPNRGFDFEYNVQVQRLF